MFKNSQQQIFCLFVLLFCALIHEHGVTEYAFDRWTSDKVIHRCWIDVLENITFKNSRHFNICLQTNLPEIAD